MSNMPTITRIALFMVVAILAVLFFTTVFAQDAVVVVDTLPPDITSWSGLFAYWLPKALQALLAVVGTILALALRQLVAAAPAFVQAYVGAKRQRDLHSAIATKVGELIAEGRWPTKADFAKVAGDMTTALSPQLVEEVRRYVADYNPQAAKYADILSKSAKGDKLVRTLSLRKTVELLGDPLSDALTKAGVPGVLKIPQ